jgi:oligopeptide/dipeptide ABC transporter ATP-binding protein
MTPLLSVKGLTKYFPTKAGIVRAVDDVNFDVNRGETLALVGESGCGKSTVALSLLQLLKTDSGNVIFDDIDFTLLSDRQRRIIRQNLSIVFQNPYSSLNPKMRVIDIIGEPLKTNLGLKGKDLTKRVTKHLEEVGLGSEHLRRYPHEFSGGQRQRIAIARALALQPKLLILDEPTAALDVSVQAQVLNLLKELQAKYQLSFLFISHNLATVEYIAEKILVMYLGRIVESGFVKEIFKSPAHPYTRALIASIPSLDPHKRNELTALSGDVPSPLNLPTGCAFLGRCPRAVDRCQTNIPILVDSAIGQVACHNPFTGELKK